MTATAARNTIRTKRQLIQQVDAATNALHSLGTTLDRLDPAEEREVTKRYFRAVTAMRDLRWEIEAEFEKGGE